MYRARLTFTLVLALLASLAARSAVPVASTPAANAIKSMSAEFGPQRVRLSVDFSGAGKPSVQVYYQAVEGALVIDMRDVDASSARLPRLGPDSLIAAWDVRSPNFMTAQWVVKLGYAVPTSHVRSQIVGNTLTVDIGRNFTESLDMPVSRNVEWRRREVRVGDDYYLLNELEIKPGKQVEMRVAHAGDNITSVEDPVALAQRKGALALINGGFFKYSGGPLSVVIDEGRVLVPHVPTRPPRTIVGFTRDGQVLMNRVEVKDNVARAIDGNADWSKVSFAVGAGPRLIRDGKIALTTDEEALGPAGNDITRKAGRTAVAKLKNGHILLVTLSGYRDNHGQGWQLPVLAAYLLSRGAVDAMNLDGGGSVAMVLDGALVSRPPARAGGQRKVANGVMVLDQGPRLLPARVKLTASKHRLPADGRTAIQLVAEVANGAGKPVADGTPVYFATTAGQITPQAKTVKGRAVASFVPLRAGGTSRVFAYCGLVSGEDAVVVEAGPPKRIVARVVEVRSPPPAPMPSTTPGPQPTPVGSPTKASSLEVMVLDTWCNPLPGQDVEVEYGGSKVRVQTGLDGIGRVPLAGEARGIKVGAGGLPIVSIP